MNGYEILANSYRALAQRGEIDKETADKEIRIFDFLASCDKDDIYRLVDSSAFNDIIKAFVRAAAKNADVSGEVQEKILTQLCYLFDDMQAKDVCAAVEEN